MSTFLKWNGEIILRSCMVEGDGVDHPYWVLASEIDTLFFAYGEKYDHTIDVDNCTLFALCIVFSFFFFLLSLDLAALSLQMSILLQW